MNESEQEYDYTMVEAAEAIQGASFMLGHSSGITNAAKHFEELSGKAFINRNDEKAKLYREVSDILKVLSAEARKTYDTYSAKRQEKAFRIIDKFDKELTSFKETNKKD